MAHVWKMYPCAIICCSFVFQTVSSVLVYKLYVILCLYMYILVWYLYVVVFTCVLLVCTFMLLVRYLLLVSICMLLLCLVCTHMYLYVLICYSYVLMWCFSHNQLRWPNTVIMRAFADAIQHVHKGFKKQTCRQ